MKYNNTKNTLFYNIYSNEYDIIERDGDSIRIKDKLKRFKPRWFNLSRKGNYYSRYTGKQTDSYAICYIIKNTLPVCDGCYTTNNVSYRNTKTEYKYIQGHLCDDCYNKDLEDNYKMF